MDEGNDIKDSKEKGRKPGTGQLWVLCGDGMGKENVPKMKTGHSLMPQDRTQLDAG